LKKEINKKKNDNQLLKSNNYFINNNSSLIINNIEKQIEPDYSNEGKIDGSIILNHQPTLVGLNNIGAACFVNATLQCLSQTKELTNYFLNKSNRNKIINNNIAFVNQNGLQLSPAYLELVNILWTANGPKSYSPYNFMNIINKMKPLFQKGQQGDSKDFIIFILEQLHKELKSPVRANNNINMTKKLNQFNQYNSFSYFYNDFKKESSIISDTFFGFTETTYECLYCKQLYNSQGFNNNPISYNYGTFNCLIFPLEEVKKMKNNIMNFNYLINNHVSLQDCFIYNQNSEHFTGKNRNYCNICKQLYDSIYTSKIYISPNVLILILNRGKDNIYDVKLDFTETIDISPFVSQKEMIQIIYNLYGVISHIGQSGPNADYIAACKSPVDNNWYRYNDAIVSPITNITKDVIEFGTPCVLFYRKNKD
jgi:ubiquitin C-terminal hydrolase